jgi:prevent-host-death family protein
MKSMSISEFKTHALGIIEKIAETREQITITKRGKPIAIVAPYQEQAGKPKSGKLSQYLVYEKDIVTPLGEEMWEASH